MRTELVSIATETVPLDGAFYASDRQPRGAVLLLHGHAQNFYTGPSRFLPPALTTAGFACLAFNRRGHDILAIRDSRVPEGGAMVMTRDGLADIASAAIWLKERGFSAPALIGHSYGGTLAVQHAADHPETPALVLLSAHAGKSKVRSTGVFGSSQGGALIAQAEDLVRQGRGASFISMPDFWYFATADSIVDRMANTPDILALASRVTCPSLFIRGDEPADLYPAERFRDLSAGPCDVELLSGCDHFYKGAEKRTASVVASWLTRRTDSAS
jgi:pimeloyl-ACP methyl ester carboxylesterase